MAGTIELAADDDGSRIASWQSIILSFFTPICSQTLSQQWPAVGLFIVRLWVSVLQPRTKTRYAFSFHVVEWVHDFLTALFPLGGGEGAVQNVMSGRFHAFAMVSRIPMDLPQTLMEHK